MADHMNLISEVESTEVQILAAIVRLDIHGESDGGLKNAISALWGSILWAPGRGLGFEVWPPAAPSPKQLWTQIWIHELTEHIHCSFLLLHHQVSVSSKFWPVQQLEIHWIIKFTYYSFYAKQVSQESEMKVWRVLWPLTASNLIESSWHKLLKNYHVFPPATSRSYLHSQKMLLAELMRGKCK